MSKNPSIKTPPSDTRLKISTQDVKDELEVVLLPDAIKDHDYCIVLPQPIKSPIRVGTGFFLSYNLRITFNIRLIYR